MPVTARLSEEFYERFGHDLVGKLVDWFNQVDATYRHDLRELNELNFARFGAKLEQRIVEVGRDMEIGFARADVKLEQRIGELRVDMPEHGNETHALDDRVMARYRRDAVQSLVGREDGKGYC